MNLALRHCSTCGRKRLFERPPCVDGHGVECPEWACVGCGSAIVVGLDLDIEFWAEAPLRAA